MSESSSKLPAWTLVNLFMAILGVTPLIQVVVEWRRGERIQAVDLFRYPPWSENLRRFERTLEAQSWLQGVTRPVMREAWFELLGEPGPQALVGSDGWLFYRPGVRYLVEAGGFVPGEGRWKAPETVTRRAQAVRTIRQFRDALRERGIQLLVMPVPGKASVYPDRLSTRYREQIEAFRSPTEEFVEDLRTAGIEVVDLFAHFRELRGSGVGLYLAEDTHWTPHGAELAAAETAERLMTLGWVKAGTNAYTVREVAVRRRGDIVELIRLQGVRRRFGGETVTARQVLDTELGLLVPSRAQRPGIYRDPRGQSRVLLLGDSFSRVYQFAEPRTLGERPESSAAIQGGEPEPGVAPRLYPGSAGLVSHLARRLSGPVDAVVSEGGASTDVRRRLSVTPEILEGKQVVIWEFVERDLELGEWAEVPLPRRLEGD